MFFYVSQMLAWQFAGLAAIAVWTAALSLLLFGTLKLLRLLRVSEEIEMKGLSTLKAPPTICSRRQFQILPLFQKSQMRYEIS